MEASWLLTFVRNHHRLSAAAVVCLYYLGLSLAQTQWAFYLCASWLFAVAIAFTPAIDRAAPKTRWLKEALMIWTVLGAGLYSRLSLQSFDNIHNLDDLLRDHTVFLLAGLAIPTGIVTAFRKLFEAHQAHLPFPPKDNDHAL